MGRFFFLVFLPVLFFCPLILLAQEQMSVESDVENMLFDDTLNRLKVAIMAASGKQSLYAYNIANAATPEFEPILPPDEQAELDRLMPPGESNRQVMNEFILSKMTENRLRYTGYINLQKKKFEVLRQVVTLGKR